MHPTGLPAPIRNEAFVRDWLERVHKGLLFPLHAANMFQNVISIHEFACQWRVEQNVSCNTPTEYRESRTRVILPSRRVTAWHGFPDLQATSLELHQEVVCAPCSQEEEATALAGVELQMKLDSAVCALHGHLHITIAEERCWKRGDISRGLSLSFLWDGSSQGPVCLLRDTDLQKKIDWGPHMLKAMKYRVFLCREENTTGSTSSSKSDRNVTMLWKQWSTTVTELYF